MAKLSLTINNVDDDLKRKIKKAKFEGVEDLKHKNKKLTISYNPKVVDSYGVIERIKHLDINGEILKDDNDISSKNGNSFTFSMYKEGVEENVVKKANIFDDNENMQNTNNYIDNNSNNCNNLYGINNRDNYDKLDCNGNNADNNFDQIYDMNNMVNNYTYPNGEDLYEQLDNAYDDKNYKDNYKNYEANHQKCEQNYKNYEAIHQKCEQNYKNYEAIHQKCEQNYKNYESNHQNHEQNYKSYGDNYQNCNVSEKNENINSNYNSTNNKGDLYDINYYPNQVEKVEESEGVDENRKSSKFSVLNLFNNIKKSKDKKKMKKEIKKDYLNEDYNNLDKRILLSNDMYKNVENKNYNNSNDNYNSNNNYYYDYNEEKLKKKNFNFRDYESYRDKQNIYICELKIYNMSCDNCGKKIINFLKDKKLILEGNSFATDNKIKLKVDISSDIIHCNNNVKMFVNTIMNEIKESGFNNDLLDLYKDDKNRCNLSEITLYIYRDDIKKSYKLLKDIKGISNVEYDLKKEYIYFLYDPELVGIRYILEILKKKKNVDAYYDEDKEKYFRSSQNNETNNTWKLIELSICIIISIIIIVLNNYQMNMGSMNGFYSYTKKLFDNSNKIDTDNIKHPSIYHNIGNGTPVDQSTLDIYFENVTKGKTLNEYVHKQSRRDEKGTFFINSNFKFIKKNKDSPINRKWVDDDIKKGQILNGKKNKSIEYNNTINMLNDQIDAGHYNNQEGHKDYPLDNENNVSKYIECTNSENRRKNYLLNEKDDDDNNKEKNINNNDNNNDEKNDNFNNDYNKDDYYDDEHYDIIPIGDFRKSDISEKHPDNKKGDNTKNGYSRFRKHINTNLKNKNNKNESDGEEEKGNIDGIYILKQKNHKKDMIKGEEENKDNFSKKEEKSDNENSNEEIDKNYNYLKRKEKDHNSSNDEDNINDSVLKENVKEEEIHESSSNEQSDSYLKKIEKKDNKNISVDNNENDNFLKKKEMKDDVNNENEENRESSSLLKENKKKDNKNISVENNENDNFLKKNEMEDQNNKHVGSNVDDKEDKDIKGGKHGQDVKNDKHGQDVKNVKHGDVVKDGENENDSYDETEEDNFLMKKKEKKDENSTKDEKENIVMRKNKNSEISNEENNATYENENIFMNKNKSYNNSYKNEGNDDSLFSFNNLFYKLANYSIYLDMDTKIVKGLSLRLFFIFVLSSFVYIYYGFSFVLNGYKNLKNNMINMNVLISISSSFSYFYSLLLLLFCLIFSIDLNGIPLYFDSSALLICIMKFGCEIENFLVSFSKKKMEDLYESTAKNVYILEKKNRYYQDEEGNFNSNIPIKSMSNISKAFSKDNNSNSIIANSQINSNDILQSVGKENIKVDTLKNNLSFSTSSFFLSNQFLYDDDEINKILSQDMDININDYNINSYPVQFIQKNDILIFYEGSTLLIDGIKINKGISCVDESMISGEKNAIKKYKGDKVYAGSKCVEGVVIIYVKDISKGNYIEYVKQTLDEINCKKTNLQLYADKIASIFIPFILILCIVVFFIWFILTFFDIVNIKKENYFKLNRFLSCVFFSVHFSLSILCVACPCAVGLASPLSIAISTYICSSIGIIIKNINIFEIFLECKHFIFDKTGTLTVGKPVVNKIYISNNIDLFIDQLLKNKSGNHLSVSFNDNKNAKMPALVRAKSDEKKVKKMNNNMKDNVNKLYSTAYSINDQPSNGYNGYMNNFDEQGLEGNENMMKNNTLNFVENFSCCNKNVSFYSFTTEKEYFKIEIKKTSRNRDKVKKKKKYTKNETRNNYDESSLSGDKNYQNYQNYQNDQIVSNSCMGENKSILNSIVSFITDKNKKNKYNKILDNSLKEHFINNSDNYFSSNDDSYYSETTSNENEHNKYDNIPVSNNIMDQHDHLQNMSSPLEEENSYMEKSSDWLYLFLSLSLNIEKYSNHLFATSINTYINNNFSINEVFDVNNLKNEKNQGISCIINDLTITIGTLFFCYTKYKNIYCNKVPIIEEKLTVKSMERHIYSCDCNVHKTYQYLYSYSNSKKNESNNIIFMCIEGIVVGFFTLVDNIKPEVFELINFLKREKKKVYVCTGDNYMNALYISKILGIKKENVSSNTLPLEKVQFVKKVQSMNDGKVCMIGDGINDCFALKTADLGLSLCTRTNVVMDSADACIVDNNINVIIKLFEISRKTLLVIKFNFLFSFFINIFFILLASGAFYSLNYVFSPFLFTFLMFCSSIIVILSSLSLKLLLKNI
ncbi:hypothetical protein PFFCH_01610 [Plasmodium falciparum FCH/4]|uniref:P-type ATPase A domain-containing protein n=1 Tax=Plasmodium falciparum FCH/4 TaxID=1036724 RepID=A0A024VRM8_PLAFA|nr:hypothetical protein PFFCH_01610 [Plasmodium falciparum FCH/4]